jgi:hypothetical protein
MPIRFMNVSQLLAILVLNNYTWAAIRFHDQFGQVVILSRQGFQNVLGALHGHARCSGGMQHIRLQLPFRNSQIIRHKL